MTALLQKAFDQASKLSSEEQDLIARELLNEIEGESLWDSTFNTSASENLLEKMASKAKQDVKEGRVTKGGFDAL